LPARAEEWRLQAAPALIYDSNASHGQSGSDRLDDEVAALSILTGPLFVLTGRDVLALSGDVETAQHLRYWRLSSVDAGTGVDYRHKFGLGRFVPWVNTSVSIQRRGFYRSAMRDGYAGLAQLLIGKRFSGRFEASIGTEYDWRIAKSGTPEDEDIPATVFNVHGISIVANGHFQANSRLGFAGTLSLRQGDVNAGAGSEDTAYGHVHALAEDPAFKGDFYAYRLPGTTVAAEAGFDWTLCDHAAVRFRGDVDRTYASSGPHYDGGALRLSFLYWH
jgi:hypothetical protein